MQRAHTAVHVACTACTRNAYAERMQCAPRRKRSLVRRMPAKSKLTIAAHAAAVTIAVIVAAVTIAAAAASAAGTRRALRMVSDTPARDTRATHQLR